LVGQFFCYIMAVVIFWWEEYDVCINKPTWPCFSLIYIELVHWNKSSQVDRHVALFGHISLADKLQFDSQRFDPTEYRSHDRRCKPSQHRSARLFRYPVDNIRVHVPVRHTRLTIQVEFLFYKVKLGQFYIFTQI
jgi:hypothetical protein